MIKSKLMKRLLITFLMLFTAYLSSDAQTLVTIGTGSEVPSFTLYSPIYRFSGTSSTRFNRSNILFTAAELSAVGLPTGAVVTGISFDKNGTGGTNTPSNLTIRMFAANSATAPPLSTATNWTDILASHSQVLNDAAFVIPATTGWVQFPFTSNFTYTGGSLEIAIENEMSGGSPYATNKWDWKYTNGFADYIVAGISSNVNFLATMTSSTSSYKNRPNVQIHYVVPQGTDLGVQNLLSPTSPIASGNSSQVLVALSNNATTTITSAQVHYQVDSGAIVTEAFSGNIVQATTTQFGFAAPLIIPAATFQLKVWVSNVNGAGPDNNTSNDTLTSTVCPALPAGTYTVGGTSPNFATIDDAVNAASCGGIGGPVIFSIRPGTYSVNTTLNNVPGATSGNSITFTSSTAVVSDVVLTPDANTSVMVVNGVQGITFSNLTFQRSVTPASLSHLLHYTSSANGGVVINCNFIDSVGTVTFTNKGLGISNTSNMLIQSNTFSGFYYAIEMEGAAPYATQNVVSNNMLSNYFYRAMFIGEQAGLQLINNRIVDFVGTSTSGAGIYMNANSGFLVTNNEVSGGMSGYGIYAFNVDGDSLAPSQMYNNVVATFTAVPLEGASITHYGYYLGSSTATTSQIDYLQFYNNTAHMAVASVGTSTLQAGLYITGGSTTTPAWGSLDMRNNVIAVYSHNATAIPPNMRPFKASIPLLTGIVTMDYNNFFIDDPTFNLMRVNLPTTEYPTLADWTAATGFDSSSLSVNPVFATLGSGLPTSASLDNAGLPLALVVTDITGASRSLTTPDMGAYEFQPNSRDLAVTSLITPGVSCGLGAAELVTISLENIGLDTISTASITLIFNNGTPQVNTLNRSINPGDTIHFTFANTVNMAIGGNYAFEFYVSTANDGNPLNDTLRTTVLNPLLTVFPYLMDFESGNTGLATGLPDGWTIDPTAGFAFYVEDGTTSSTNTGPAVDHTLGTAAGKYIYSEASSGSIGSIARLISPCLDLSTLANPALQFWFHMYGSDIDRLDIEAEVGGNWIIFDSIVGQQQTSNGAAWMMFRTLIPGNTAALRFSVTRGASFDGDVALDDIRIIENPTTDIRAYRLVSPLQGCSLGNNEPIVAEFINAGLDTLMQSPVGYRINGGTVSVGSLSGVFPGDTMQYTFPVNADLSILGGNYFIEVFNSNLNDGFVANDSTSATAHNYPSVNSYPYNQDFEANDGGWFATGDNNSWAYGTPAGTVIDTAAGGTKAWVTNLIGNYNTSESSYLQSPCFDFSTLLDPDVEFDIWWNTNFTSGVTNLAYSINGGATWIPVGNGNSGISNWFNYGGNTTSLSQPGWQGNPGSGGWLRAKHNLAFLAGEANVSFRIQFYSSTSTIVREGVGIDNFIISQRTSPIFTALTEASDSCVTAPRAISADILHAFPLTSVLLSYDLTNTGAFVTTPMALSAGSWTGTIPQSSPAIPVNYRVIATDSASQSDTTSIASYIDDYLVISAGNDTAIIVGDTATLTATYQSDFPILITEVDLGGTDAFEIQNVSNASVNITGWKVAVSNSYSDINSVNSVVQTLTGFMAPGQTMTWSDASTATNYWGNNLLWNPGAFPTFSGWVLLLSPTNEVVDAMFWGWPATNIQSAAIAVSGAPVNLAGAWISDGIDASSVPAGVTISRIGNQDNNDSTGYALLNMSLGATNPGLQLPFRGGSVIWTTLTGAVVDTVPVIQVTPTTTTTYVVTLSDGFCSKTDTVVVNVGQLIPDIGVSSFISPNASTILDGSQPVTVTVVIQNYGPTPATGFDVEYRVDGGASLVTNSITSPLAPGDSIQHSFTVAWTPTAGGAAILCANTTGLPNEVNRANDTACVTAQPTVSIAELQNSSRLIGKVYPNPAESFVNFAFNEFNGRGILEIHDNLGRVVATIAVDRENGKLHTVRTDSWSAGMYSYRFIASDQVQHGNLIVNH